MRVNGVQVYNESVKEKRGGGGGWKKKEECRITNEIQSSIKGSRAHNDITLFDPGGDQQRI